MLQIIPKYYPPGKRRYGFLNQRNRGNKRAKKKKKKKKKKKNKSLQRDLTARLIFG